MKEDTPVYVGSFPKTLEEVWQWKEKLYEQIKNLPKDEQLKFIIAQTDETAKKIQEAQQARVERLGNKKSNAG